MASDQLCIGELEPLVEDSWGEAIRVTRNDAGSILVVSNGGDRQPDRSIEDYLTNG